jgi:Putative zinc dependent peptidase (DUF5700)
MKLITKVMSFLLSSLLISNVYANITVKDYTKGFVEGYKQLQKNDPATREKYVLNYELVKEPEVSRIFFDGHRIPRDPRIKISLHHYVKNLPELANAYQKKAPEIKSIASEVDERVQRIFGMKINAKILLSTSVSETDAVTMGSDDRHTYPVVALNMREMVKYSKDELRIVLAHELFHVLQHQIEVDHSNTEMIAGNLYSEGWATYGSSLVYPGFADWKYISYFTKNNKQFLRFEADRKEIIQHLLHDWNSKNERKYDKYFSANLDTSKPFEPRSGYYIGYLAAKTLAEKDPPVKVALIKYSDFKKQIKPLLKKMLTSSDINIS